MKNERRRLVLKATFLMALITPAARPAAIAPVPDVVSIEVGQTFNLSIEVTNVTISGYGFDVGWQPGLLELTSITPANIFAPLTTIQFFPSTPDASGLASGLAESVAGPGSFTGSGSLMTLAFKGLANGNTSIELSNLLLLDEFGDPFNVEIGTAEVTVGAIPEPGTGALMSCVLGIAAIGWLRRRR